MLLLLLLLALARPVVMLQGESRRSSGREEDEDVARFSLGLAEGELVRFKLELVPAPPSREDGSPLLRPNRVCGGSDVPPPEKGVVVEPLSVPV